jgi:hypothetical protein
MMDGYWRCEWRSLKYQRWSLEEEEEDDDDDEEEERKSLFEASIERGSAIF